MKAAFALPIVLVLSSSPYAVAFASSATTGPNAVLHKLDDKWVSILPESETPAQPAVVPPSAAPLSAPAASVANLSGAADPAPDAASSALAELQASLPPVDPDYSGTCHVTGNLFSKTYRINETSSTEMVRELPYGSACFPTEKSARAAGFALEKR